MSDIEPPDAGVSRGLVALLAVAVGATVANRYYVEPLLTVVAHAFRVSETSAGLLVTAAQVGYVRGLALLVPLGDLVPRQRLVVGLLVGAAAAAMGAAAAPSLTVLAAALAVLGVLSVAAQILVPLAATLAADDQRGRVVGTVTSGLLVGILLARTVSGLLAGWGGFRTVFLTAAGVMVVLAAVLHRALPAVAPTRHGSYRALLGSVLTLVAAEPELRRRMVLGGLQMAGFAVLWTPSAFLLAGPPYRYGTAVIGLFGLIGAVGVIGAPLAGRLADLGQGEQALTMSLVATLAAWPLLGFGRSSPIALITGIAVLDLGVQGARRSAGTDLRSGNQETP